ncbi:MAG: hypothetical protein H7323_15050 [Frankiales bacterium]|nr:hypothetical protein [Frankiales bacterium]
MRRRSFRTAVFSCLLAVFALAGGGQAIAYWSGWGAGSGSASTGTALALTVSPGSAAMDLYPGGHTGVMLVLSNPNGFAVHIGSLALDTSRGIGGYGVDAGHSGCAVAALTYTTQTNLGTGWTVPAQAGAVAGTLPATLAAALTLSADAVDACQGASFTIYLDARS